MVDAGDARVIFVIITCYWVLMYEACLGVLVLFRYLDCNYFDKAKNSRDWEGMEIGVAWAWRWCNRMTY